MCACDRWRSPLRCASLITVDYRRLKPPVHFAVAFLHALQFMTLRSESKVIRGSVTDDPPLLFYNWVHGFI